MLPYQHSQSGLIVLRGTDELDADSGAIDPTNSGKWNVHGTGLIRQKQTELYVITDAQGMDAFDEAARL
jgi:hypothetical protein